MESNHPAHTRRARPVLKSREFCDSDRFRPTRIGFAEPGGLAEPTGVDQGRLAFPDKRRTAIRSMPLASPALASPGEPSASGVSDIHSRVPRR
jgi:hypothetical protein